MKYKIRICSKDETINRIVRFTGIIVEAENENDALKKAYDSLYVELYQVDNLDKPKLK